MPPFRWKNCRADIEAAQHDKTILLYLEDVILPALATLDRKLEEGRIAQPPAWPFIEHDLIDTERETKRAFALSIQSVWERQIRSYLIRAAEELLPEMSPKIPRAPWSDFDNLFFALRGIKLSQFPSFDALDTLQYVGNACRHGEGNSASEVARRCPEFWEMSSISLPDGTRAEFPKLVSTMNIPRDWLAESVRAIAAFWQDAEYIYCESIDRKAASLEARLLQERQSRAWLPQRV